MVINQAAADENYMGKKHTENLIVRMTQSVQYGCYSNVNASNKSRAAQVIKYV